MLLQCLSRHLLRSGVSLFLIGASTATPQATTRQGTRLSTFTGTDEVQCHPNHGNELSYNECIDAVDQMPADEDLRRYTQNPNEEDLHVPLVYQSIFDTRCYISVDVIGGGAHRSYMASPKKVKEVAKAIVDTCVGEDVYRVGGMSTIGLDAVSQHIARNGLAQPIPASIFISVTSLLADEADLSSRNEAVLSRVMDALEAKLKTLENNKDTASSSTRKTISASLDVLDEIWEDEASAPFWYDLGHHQTTRRMPRNVKYDCIPALGSPTAPSCEHVLYELQSTGGVIIDPSAGPIVRASGDCAIAISATKKTYTSWSIVKATTTMLISQCITAPLSAHVGGVATAQRRDQQGTAALTGLSATLAVGMQIVMYYKQAYGGNASDICALEVARNSTGGITECHI